jgi:predicted DNA-binding transcriptional regulator AlpA
VAYCHRTVNDQEGPELSDPCAPPVELLPPEEVCRILGIEKGTLYQWHRRKYGPQPAKVGSLLRYSRAEVEAFVLERLDARGSATA